MREKTVTSPDELRRRLPEIDGVRGDVQDEVISAFITDIPEYFWLARSSESHHPPDERGLCGTWIHVKRVFTAYTMLERTFRAMSRISSFEANCARAAILLHDGFKYGREPQQDDTEDYHEYGGGHLRHIPEYTDTAHDVLMAEYVRTETDMPEEVAHAIECHGGSPDWFGHDGPRPDDDLTLIVHLADLLASNANHRIPVYEPCTELTRVVDDLPTVTDDWSQEIDDF